MWYTVYRTGRVYSDRADEGDHDLTKSRALPCRLTLQPNIAMALAR